MRVCVHRALSYWVAFGQAINIDTKSEGRKFPRKLQAKGFESTLKQKLHNNNNKKNTTENEMKE